MQRVNIRDERGTMKFCSQVFTLDSHRLLDLDLELSPSTQKAIRVTQFNWANDWAQQPVERTQRESSTISAAAVTSLLSKLTITAASLLLDRFNRTPQEVNKNALVSHMTALRNKGLNAHHFIDKPYDTYQRPQISISTTKFYGNVTTANNENSK